ncbi:hypothetical protein ACDZ29_03555 [Peribacillus sp. RS7]|jgi:hypothetical protein|uniref:hypothetical protein n=1 Tax=Peribacillus TaxID=2675229 RepID=UPI0025A055D1|nr:MULTISPECIES: hypothetical protein [unclassified Peribacillus]MDM5221510.1 hypothetical protein [Peribacillus sp. NJ11]MDM5360218.1 hypothetical protein [Peribacillus sp. ACCC06369]
MKRFFKFIADFNERKAMERETEEFFRKEYENYMKMNPENQGKRRLAPRFYVIDGGKKGSNLEISDRKKSS